MSGGAKKKGIVQVPEGYNRMGLSQKKINLGERREREVDRHQTNLLRKWERCVRNPRDEAVAQLSDQRIMKVRDNRRTSKQA